MMSLVSHVETLQYTCTTCTVSSVYSINVHDVTSQREQVFGGGVHSHNAFVRLDGDDLLVGLLRNHLSGLPVAQRRRQCSGLSEHVDVATDVSDGCVAEVGAAADEAVALLRRQHEPERIERCHVLPWRGADVISGLPDNSVDVVTQADAGETIRVDTAVEEPLVAVEVHLRDQTSENTLKALKVS